MGLRPGRCYHKQKQKPYTRIAIRVPSKGYVKGVPASKIHQFEVGKKGFPLTYHLVATADTLMRSNALEAARIIATKYLTDYVGENGFFLKVRTYPHHVLRENPLATGAGADRFSSGMRRSFGKPIGQAAIVRSNQKVISVFVPQDKAKEAKTALQRAAAKLPGMCRVLAE